MNKKGLTLVELMVALVIFGLFMASIVQVLSMQNRKSVQVQSTSNLQMDAQVAFNILKNDIYHAGLGIGVERFSIISQDGGTNAPDQITLLGVALGSEVPVVRWNPVVQRSEGGVLVCRRWGDVSRDIAVNDTILILSPEKNLIIDNLKVQHITVDVSDPTIMEVRVNNTSASANASSIVYCIQNNNVYTNGITYRIQTIDGIPVLMRGNERFLENVEDLEFAYGIDVDDDGEVEPNEFENSLENFQARIQGFNSSVLYDRTFVIRVSMLVRTESRLQDVRFAETMQIENRTINFTDTERRFDRLLLSTTISPRNIRR